MSNKNISIVVNHEKCPHNCWFCIWKGHPLENIYGPKIEDIKNFLLKYKEKGYTKFSISGSDIIFEQLNNYVDFWDNINKLCSHIGMQFDIHTRSRIYDRYFIQNENLRKLVLSTSSISDTVKYLDWLYYTKPDLQIRLVKVITETTNNYEMEDYIHLCLDYDIQLTFKQLVNHDDDGKYEYFKKKFKHTHPNVMFLDKGDYNIYLMPDGKEYNEFLIGD